MTFHLAAIWLTLTLEELTHSCQIIPTCSHSCTPYREVSPVLGWEQQGESEEFLFESADSSSFASCQVFPEHPLCVRPCAGHTGCKDAPHWSWPSRGLWPGLGSWLVTWLKSFSLESSSSMFEHLPCPLCWAKPTPPACLPAVLVPQPVLPASRLPFLYPLPSLPGPAVAGHPQQPGVVSVAWAESTSHWSRATHIPTCHPQHDLLKPGCKQQVPTSLRSKAV